MRFVQQILAAPKHPNKSSGVNTPPTPNFLSKPSSVQLRDDEKSSLRELLTGQDDLISLLL